jgi:hypothetical protein
VFLNALPNLCLAFQQARQIRNPHQGKEGSAGEKNYLKRIRHYKWYYRKRKAKPKKKKKKKKNEAIPDFNSLYAVRMVKSTMLDYIVL